jgi:hypothetical protein
MIGAKSLGANQTEIHLGSGVTVFVSYQTPVAAFVSGRGWLRTKGWSNTTMKHITQWLGDKETVEVVSEDEIKALMSGGASPNATKRKVIPVPTGRVIKLKEAA